MYMHTHCLIDLAVLPSQIISFLFFRSEKVWIQKLKLLPFSISGYLRLTEKTEM